MSENEQLMVTHGYRTVGEMLYRDAKFSENKRNKAENYMNTVSRAMVLDEINAVFAAQKAFGNPYATDDIKDKYIAIVSSQRSFEDGPGGESSYGGNQIERMIGSCSLLADEKRAPKASYSFQLFSLLQNINNTVISNASESRVLTDDERKIIIDLCHKSPSVTYLTIREKLGIPADWVFNKVRYTGSAEASEAEKKTKFDYLKSYHDIRKALDKLSKNHISVLSVPQLNAIGYAFTVYRTDDKISAYLSENGLSAEEISALLTIGGFTKFGHISVKACDMLIPYLEKGMKYNEACDAAGIDFKGHSDGEKSFCLPANAPELEDINNPVVRRAVSQTIKVINAIIRLMDESPVYINIELARELSKTFDERKKAEKSIEENRSKNEHIKERLQSEFNVLNPTGLDIVKMKLWTEQDGICPYTQQQISVARLFEAGYTDVDHIIPYSISFDDSYSNKVLTFSKENRQKGNRIPLEYLSDKRRDDYLVWVNANVKNYNKKKNLLKEHISDSDFDGFKRRNLTDTAYLSSLLYNYINDRLEFTPYADGGKKHVTSVNGSVTAYMRKRWGIAKIREDGDLHHAVDAAVVACTTNAMIQKVSRFSKLREIEYVTGDDGAVAVDGATGEVLGEFPQPYKGFRKELEARSMNNAREAVESLRLPSYSAADIEAVETPFVSRMCNHKVTGEAHEATVRSERKKGYATTKTPLEKLSLDKEGEIKNYCEDARISDALLYNALKKRLTMFGGDGKAAFGNGYVFHKPKADGSDGPVVKKVLIEERSSLNVPVRDGNGIASNGSMVRIDVFHIEGDGYYFVPIYVADTKKPVLPNKAVVQSKEYDLWKEMNDDDFLFSLYNNDLIRVRSRRGMDFVPKNDGSTLQKKHISEDAYLYYIKAGISTGSITVESHDGAYVQNSLGIKTLEFIEKYSVDPLGNITKVNREKRMGFH